MAEYHHEHTQAASCEELLKQINSRAADGWQLVSVVIEPGAENTWHAFFKRQTPIIPSGE